VVIEKSTRWPSLILGVLVVAALMALAPAVRAACTDAPAPGVNWQRCYVDNRDLRELDLTNATLRGAFLARSDFSFSDLSAIDGRRAKFVKATLVETVFDKARLLGADFTKADLTGASFRDADLRRARFFRAVLRGADFTGARLKGADLLKADLSAAIWIDGVTVCSEGSIGQCY
jgi:uncharacterized protein YjbI with pentapeptide repeats